MYLNEMIQLIKTKPFDSDHAAIVLQEISDIDQTILVGEYGYKRTLLGEAVDNNNLGAVQFLLEHGANPNYISEDFDCPLSDLEFGYDEDIPEEDHTRYEIAKKFFEYGADPNLLLEGETIFDSVTYSIYNHGGGPSWPYRVEFYKLLVIYGGGGHIYENGAQGYGKPEFSEPIDFSRIDEYQVCFRKHEDGYHIEGHLLNPAGKDIGIL
ncbi:MAG: ankyrin repeat domain-containing protein [Oscillospiraceae bacterium]|nr:ankyrin repeat domain-containing protein [Oscillospiraceae bacterium]